MSGAGRVRGEAGPLRPGGRWRLDLGLWAANGALVAYIVISLVPLAWLLITSFKYQVDMFARPPRLLFTPTLDHYVTVLGKSNFPSYVKNSLLAGGLATGASLVIGSLCAYGIARFDFRGRGAILLWVLVVRLIPPLALIIPFYMMLRSLGLYDTVLGLGIVYLSLNLPLTVWLMTTYFAEVPVAVEEAAMVDGCSRIGALWRVVLPLTAPGLVATSVITLIFSWNEFPFALMLTAGEAKTAPVSITEWLVERGLLWGELSASGTLIILPVLIFAAFVQRHLVRGLTIGAVKS
ncbi:MAG: carbohydrate ABC transporter permease [Armatimonadetes bacterium]|nr:carbohydrate ABC transporter permease [Armatimonadota bacterium]